MQTRNTIFTMTMLFVIILSRASESSVETWGQERVKKCRFWISTELAFKNLSFRTRIGDVCDVGIHFWITRKIPFRIRFLHRFLSPVFLREERSVPFVADFRK